MQVDITIIGGGILGTTLSYFLAHLNPDKKICVIDQERDVAHHTSSRNTGKVHAPYLYNPKTKKIFAKATFVGFNMWETYASLKNLPFKKDGVTQIALDQKGIKTLETYLKWGKANGLNDSDMHLFLDKSEIKQREPNLQCQGALVCSRDGSVDYQQFTKALKADAQNLKVNFVLNSKVIRCTKDDTVNHSINIQIKQRYKQQPKKQYTIIPTNTDSATNYNNAMYHTATINTKFLINAAGGQSMDIAHNLGAASKYTDLHFRGEYWICPPQYNGLTKSSVYTVPEFLQYPFLDPHWIVKHDNSSQIGPNAVPVFSPYGYTATENIKKFISKSFETLSFAGTKKIVFDPKFQSLVFKEIGSSVSKRIMINRVKKFLPEIKPEKFTQKGFAGIRSSVINKNGDFESDVILEKEQNVVHILNYNSPGASGVLPFCAFVIQQLNDEGYLPYTNNSNIKNCGPWKFLDIIESMCDKS